MNIYYTYNKYKVYKLNRDTERKDKVHLCIRTHESEPKPFLYPFLPRLDSECFDMPAKEGFNSLCLHYQSLPPKSTFGETTPLQFNGIKPVFS